MYRFYNAHPQGKRVGDCVKRAITVATGMDYRDVQLALNRYKKVTGAAKFNSNRNPEKYVENVLKGKRMSFPAVKGCRRMNGEQFCWDYPVGTYILQMAGHWTVCVDGVIYDTWNCLDKCVYLAWEIKPSVKHAKITINSTISEIEYYNDNELKDALKRKIDSVTINKNTTITVEVLK